MNAPANAMRGEVTLTLNGRSHKLRPSWQAIVSTEADLGESLVLITRKVTKGIAPLRYLAVIAFHGIAAAGASPQPTFEAVAEEIWKHGILDAKMQAALSEYCMGALSGGVPLGEEKAATGRKKSSSAAS